MVLEGSLKLGFLLPLASTSAVRFFKAFFEAPLDFFLSVFSNDALLMHSYMVPFYYLQRKIKIHPSAKRLAGNLYYTACCSGYSRPVAYALPWNPHNFTIFFSYNPGSKPFLPTHSLLFKKRI